MLIHLLAMGSAMIGLTLTSVTLTEGIVVYQIKRSAIAQIAFVWKRTVIHFTTVHLKNLLVMAFVMTLPIMRNVLLIKVSSSLTLWLCNNCA